MAIVKNNVVTKGFSGMLGDAVVFRGVRGKTVVSARPRLPQRQSEQQRKNRDRFREATFFARACMLDPQKKEYYRAKARKLKLPNAYTAAITDFMRQPKVERVQCKEDCIVITARKKEFALASVDVSVSDVKDSMQITHRATLINGQKGKWVVRVPVPLLARRDADARKITIVAKDHAGNIALAA